MDNEQRAYDYLLKSMQGRMDFTNNKIAFDAIGKTVDLEETESGFYIMEIVDHEKAAYYVDQIEVTPAPTVAKHRELGTEEQPA